MRMWRILAASILLMSLVLALPHAAMAGGTWMKTPDDWVEPGEVVEMVAYVGASNVNFGPWVAYLNLEPMDSQGDFGDDRIAPLGPVVIDVTGRTGYLSHRVYLSFRLPDGLVPGIYEISVTNSEGDILGDLIGAQLPVYSQNIDLWYEWPVDEPLVARLPDYAILAGPGWQITAGEARRGVIPTSTTVSSPKIASTGITPTSSAVAVSVLVPTTVIPVRVADDPEQPESPWLLVAAIAITIGCLWIGSRVAESSAGSHHTAGTDPIVDQEPLSTQHLGGG